MKSPLNAFLEWYDSIPVAHREEVAQYIKMLNIGFEDLPDNQPEIQGDFRAKLESYIDNKCKCLGLCLMLRSQVQYLIIDKRACESAWEDAPNVTDDAISYFIDKGEASMVDRLKRGRDEMPFNKAQWLQTGQKWNSFIEEYFSNEYFDSWLK